LPTHVKCVGTEEHGEFSFGAGGEVIDWHKLSVLVDLLVQIPTMIIYMGY